jgi:hypothetical protein
MGFSCRRVGLDGEVGCGGLSEREGKGGGTGEREREWEGEREGEREG